MRIDCGRGGLCGEVADGHDGIATDTDVAAEPRCPRTVEDAAVGDLEIEHGLGARGRASGEEERECNEQRERTARRFSWHGDRRGDYHRDTENTERNGFLKN